MDGEGTVQYSPMLDIQEGANETHYCGVTHFPANWTGYRKVFAYTTFYGWKDQDIKYAVLKLGFAPKKSIFHIMYYNLTVIM